MEDKCFKGCLYRVRCADGCQWLRKQASETPSMIPELKSLLEVGKIRTYMQKKKVSIMERKFLQFLIQRNETKRKILT